jgi:D-tyrosyl-tRNA(Tyr) deacylase
LEELFNIGMRAVIQRVSSASVTIDGKQKSAIGQGLLVLLGVGHEDGPEDLDWLVKKIAGLRIFDDEAGVMNRSVVEMGGEALVVSQFTLMASTKKGNRPSYIEAAGHDKAIPMYEQFCEALSAAIGRPVGTGEFGADMKVALVNDGPVTICMDTKNK